LFIKTPPGNDKVIVDTGSEIELWFEKWSSLKGLKMAIGSSSPKEVVEFAVNQFGLSKWIDVIITGTGTRHHDFDLNDADFELDSYSPQSISISIFMGYVFADNTERM
jgi:hypothetical protein